MAEPVAGLEKRLFEQHLRHDCDDLELLGDWQFTVGVPRDSSDQFKRAVFAAAKAVSLRNRSIDYTLKRYGDSWVFRNDDDAALAFASHVKRVVTDEVEIARGAVKAMGPGDETNGRFAAWAALARLGITFRAAASGLVRGWHFEAVALERLVLEQLAWCVAVHNLSGDEHFRVMPTECIGQLKTIFPFAGRLYGVLSEIAHIHPDETPGYITFEETRITVHWTSRTFLANDASLLIGLLDLYRAVIEVIGVHPAPIDALLPSVRRVGNHWEMRDDRPFVRIRQQFEEARKQFIESAA